MYIYERSVSSVSDGLASSPSSSSSDSDIFPESAAFASLEISSTRASSSTETLETTALTIQSSAPHTTNSAPLAPSRTTASSMSSRVTQNSTVYAPESGLKAIVPATPAFPIQLTHVDIISDSDSDSDTAVSDPSLDENMIDSLGVHRSSDTRRGNERQVVRTAAPIPSRRDADARPSEKPSSRSTDDARNGSVTSRNDGRSSGPRAPPGLQATIIPGLDGESSRATTRPVASNSSDVRQGQRPGSPIRMTSSNRPVDIPSPPALPHPNEGKKTSANSPTSSPPKKVSRTNSSAPSAPVTMDAALIVATKRCVRWTENLVCPSPVPPEERRKGWFNRRG
ncbi:hypothetical protein A0H81_02692 [Grifola frondosa]|uniref:Uncharacterized protein n=1 Tax=Grifola frondosa TaxID=5627 RepID=A0A1C7MK61_GRIFR|nr:hypothetical protein A0H81_02692 [Grifola frondosa]